MWPFWEGVVLAEEGHRGTSCGLEMLPPDYGGGHRTMYTSVQTHPTVHLESELDSMEVTPQFKTFVVK